MFDGIIKLPEKCFLGYGIMMPLEDNLDKIVSELLTPNSVCVYVAISCCISYVYARIIAYKTTFN